MLNLQHVFMFLLRIAMGWFYLYAGITKVLDSEWTSLGYLKGAKSMVWLYHWLLNPHVLPVVDFMVKWGFVLLGASLILGLFVRLSGYLGALLMFLLYLPILHFPFVGQFYYIIDDHIIYILVLLLLVQSRAGQIGGLDKWFANTQLCNKYPVLRSFVS